MSKSEHAFFAFKMASLLVALAATTIALLKGDLGIARNLGFLSAGLGLVAAYFNRRVKKQARAQKADRKDVGAD